MADEKLQIPIKATFDILEVEKGAKKIQSDLDQMSRNVKKRFDDLGQKKGIFQNLENSITRVQEAIKKATNEQDIAKWNKELQRLQIEQAKYNKLGLETAKVNTGLVGTYKQLHGAAIMLGAAFAGMGVHKLIDITKQGAAFTELRKSFQGTEKDLINFQKATAGTVSKGDLIKMSNQMTDLGINLEKQTILFSLADEQASKYGTSVQDGMSKVMQASNGSERALAKLGISIITYNNNLDDLVKATGKKLEMLTLEQQEQIRLEALMRSTNMTIEQATEKTLEQIDHIERLGIAYDEMQIQIGQSIADTLVQTELLQNLNLVMTDTNELIKDQDSFFGEAASTIKNNFTPAMIWATVALKGYAKARELFGGGAEETGAYRAGETADEYAARLEKEMSLAIQVAEVNAKNRKLAAEEAGKILPSRTGAMPAGVAIGSPSAIDRMDMVDTWGGLATEDTTNMDFVIKMRQELMDARAKQDDEAIALLYQKWDAYDEQIANKEKQKWDTIQSIAQQGTDVIGDQLYNAFIGQNVNIERAFKQLLARMAADFISSGILTLLMRALNPGSAGVGLFGMLFAATGAENIQGAGTETSDSIPARLSKGESVLTAGATRAIQQSMGEGWITQINRAYARGRSNIQMGTFAGGIESLPGGRNVVSHEVGDLYIDFGDSVIQKVDYKIRTRGKIKNDRRGMS